MDRMNSLDNDKLNIGFTILSIIIPIVGFILFFVYRSKEPKKANTAVIAALLGVGLNLLFYFIGS